MGRAKSDTAVRGGPSAHRRLLAERVRTHGGGVDGFWGWVCLVSYPPGKFYSTVDTSAPSLYESLTDKARGGGASGLKGAVLRRVGDAAISFTDRADAA